MGYQVRVYMYISVTVMLSLTGRFYHVFTGKYLYIYVITELLLQAS